MATRTTVVAAQAYVAHANNHPNCDDDHFKVPECGIPSTWIQLYFANRRPGVTMSAMECYYWFKALATRPDLVQQMMQYYHLPFTHSDVKACDTFNKNRLQNGKVFDQDRYLEAYKKYLLEPLRRRVAQASQNGRNNKSTKTRDTRGVTEWTITWTITAMRDEKYYVPPGKEKKNSYQKLQQKNDDLKEKNDDLKKTNAELTKALQSLRISYDAKNEEINRLRAQLPAIHEANDEQGGNNID